MSNQEKPVQMAQTMPEIRFNLPAYQPIKLPSLGKFYKPEIPEGEIHIRPMTLREEEILTTPSLMKSGQGIDEIFKNCIQEKININELLSADKTAILLFLRAASYGREYPVKVKCADCEKDFDHVVDLEVDLNVNYYDGSFVEPFAVELPKAGTVAYIRLPRSKDEKAISKKQRRGNIDTTLSDRLNILIENINGVEDILKHQFIENLTAYDASLLKKVINKDYFGVDTELHLTCPHCGAENNIDMPINENFFRVYDPTE